MRSKLFVPGSRPELFVKAMDGAADALSFDLEDSVAEAGKADARAQLARFLGSDIARASDKAIIVRTNAQDSPHFVEDLLALAGARVDLLNVPKVESADDVWHAVDAIERNLGRGEGVPGLLVNIETPKGLRMAAEIAAAHPLVAGLQLGLGDLFEPFGIARHRAENVHAAMFAVRIAAAQAGVFACDSAHPDFRDDAGFRAEAELARGLGFVGKSCIHPRQVEWANAIFRVGEAELAAARRIVDAAQAAHAEGRGAFSVDGRMVDPPFLRRAEAIVAAAARQIPPAMESNR
ncbi:HpcH/HpaI aldolase/citrate lyase family protein [Lysobacter arvi]|uniref:CoA ester lyase n=1 Tax=Lysobacter arvi TaxID=3038776 RepID=A0ABU1CAC4_9GAMM|nr:CoA ester lyase [Lysobacter arvi]MDR0182111.1 CoA ester lyase [Lysobacter arvi]